MRRRFSLRMFVLIQVFVAAAFVVSYAGLDRQGRSKLGRVIAASKSHPLVMVERRSPLVVKPLYDDPAVVSDEELAAVLKQIRPKFKPEELKPNFVEHALRTWGVEAKFDDPTVMSGVELRDFLIDHGRFLASWNAKTEPLLVDRPTGIAVRWDRKPGGSVHHDHWLASLTEAGISLDEPVYGPARRNMQISNVLQEALRDFRLDEREIEWSAMAFGLWLPPANRWTAADGRKMTFDRLAERLMRGHERFGVCSGTHRVYSLMLLIRLDDRFDILSKPVRNRMFEHLQKIRDLIVVSQFDDGSWPSNWSQGKTAVASPIEEATFKRVIATGHHLEWLAIAPRELHPPRERILKAADWLIKNTTGKSSEEILLRYTFYSHVGNALALWRGTCPAEFWREWRKTHPFRPEDETAKE